MRDRLRAFAWHLAISAVLAGLSLLLVFLVWYPAPLQKAIGVTEIFLLVLGVDVTIGPLLTLLVYRKGKPSLRFDLATIAFLQGAALSYGLWTVAAGRPVWLAFSVDQFVVVQAYLVDERNRSAASPAFRDDSWTGPRWVAARRAETADEKREILLESLFAGVDIAQRPERYVPLEDQQAELRLKARPVSGLAKANSVDKVSEILARYPSADVYLPMAAKIQDMTVLLDGASGKILGIVDLRPES